MGDFIGKVLVLNYSEILKNEGANRKEMELIMNQMIADKAGMDLEEITPGKKICYDLGLN